MISLVVDAIFGQMNPILWLKLYFIYCNAAVSKFQKMELHYYIQASFYDSFYQQNLICIIIFLNRVFNV